MLPSVPYVSQSWLLNRTKLEQLENIKTKATKWILSTFVDYTGRLCFLQLLPLFIFLEMHDLPTLINLNENSFDFLLDDEYESVIATKQVEGGEVLIKTSKHRKTDGEIIRRPKTL